MYQPHVIIIAAYEILLFKFFNAAEGDTLKFFNTGGATFDKSSAVLADGKLKIDYGSDANDLLTIDLGNTALTLSDVSDSLIFV